MTSFSDGAPLYPAGTIKPAAVGRGQESPTTTRIRDARGALLLTHPFFGVLSLKLTLEETTDIPTMAVSTKALKYNPAFVESLGNAELKGVIAHECMHLALLHHARQESRDAGMFNEAADYTINENLIADGFTLPKGALLDARFNGMSAEQIYQRLRDEEKPEQDGQGGKQPGKGAGATGSFESAGPDGSADAAEAERDWQQNTNEAMRAASSAGKMPAGLRRTIEQALTPKADWRALLRRFMQDQIQTRSTWSKKNKRFPDIFLPGKVNDGMGVLVVAVDTSGSIDQPTLARFSAEVSAMACDLEPSAVHVVYCDTEVNNVDMFERGDTVKLAAHGGGGTRFTPVFEHVSNEGLNPVALVYLTDMQCGDWPGEQSYPVLWAAYGAAGVVAPMGETITVD